MSTIASPRDPSTALRRPPSGTPTSSGRPSLDLARSGVTSPVGGSSSGNSNTNINNNNNNNPPQPPQLQQPKRSNRAALREYYKLRAPPPPRIEVPDSEVPAGELDADDFDAAAHVASVVASCGLEDLLRHYTQVVGEVRALDAEKKALVYDNYSKLITATETIRKMRANMDPLTPMASTLDPAIAQIYSQASSIRDAAREAVPPPDSDEGRRRAADARRRRTRELAETALAAPQRLRELAKEGRMEEARRQWELPRRLLVAWREKGVGGADVQAVIDEGDAIVRPTREQRPERTSTASR